MQTSPPKQQDLIQLLSQPQNSAVKTKFFIASSLLFVLPIGMFFLCMKFILVEMEINRRITWSAIISVLLVQIILIVYIVMAYREKIPNQQRRNVEKILKKKSK